MTLSNTLKNRSVNSVKAYQIRISIKGSRPLIWRRVIIPADVTFKRLHDTLQLAMGWYDYHLHEFEFKDLKLRITNNEEVYEEYRYFRSAEGKKRLAEMKNSKFMPNLSIEVRKSDNTKIDKYIEQCKTFAYIYDFGDWWEHKIEIEQITQDYKFGYPTILDGQGACPPEDCGGMGGYENFLEAWNDENNEEHESMREWGEIQNYREFDINSKNSLLKECLKLKKVSKS